MPPPTMLTEVVFTLFGLVVKVVLVLVEGGLIVIVLCPFEINEVLVLVLFTIEFMGLNY